MPDGKRALFCVGAQKAGTTWLYDYLNGHDDCFFGFKEFHYFDLHEGVYTVQAKLRVQQISAMLAKLPRELGAEYDAILDEVKPSIQSLMSYRTGPEGLQAYLDLMSMGGEDSTYLCDFTTTNHMVSRPIMTEMSKLSDDTRCIFIMRDPIQRLWSSVRMDLEAQYPDDAEFAERSCERFGQVIDGTSGLAQRKSDLGDYASAVSTIDQVFAPDKRMYLFFEDLFQQATLDRVCDFLEIDRLTADVDTRQKEGRSVKLPDDLRAAARRKLAPQYDFVMHRFEGEVPAKWQV